MHAHSDEEETDEKILRRIVTIEARLSRRNLQIREELAIAALARADDLLALLRQQRQQPAEVDDIRPGTCHEEREHSAHPPKQLCHQRPDRGNDECIRSPDVNAMNDDLTDEKRTAKEEQIRGEYMHGHDTSTQLRSCASFVRRRWKHFTVVALTQDCDNRLYTRTKPKTDRFKMSKWSPKHRSNNCML